MNEGNVTVTVDHAPSGLKAGDVIHATPCVFEQLLKSAEFSLAERREQIRRLKLQRVFLIIAVFAALVLGYSITRL